MNEIKWKCHDCGAYHVTPTAAGVPDHFPCQCGSIWAKDDILAQHPPHVKF